MILIMNSPALVWFRMDLRLSDNPALYAAAESGREILPVFIWAPDEEGDWPPGAASRWWLHRSLRSLDAELHRRGSGLIIRRGPSLEALRSIIKESGAKCVFWNRRIEPALRSRDAGIRVALEAGGIHVETCNSTLLYNPEEVRNKSGGPFKVFTPFWKACSPAAPFLVIDTPSCTWVRKRPETLALDALGLEPSHGWAEGFGKYWIPGEEGARKKLQDFMENAIDDYVDSRDFPSAEGTSQLSPHLHFGEISPRQVESACIRKRGNAAREFLRQLGWREFAHHLLYHFPETTKSPLRPRFERFPWRKDPLNLKKWQQGRTGFPIVDAGMRQLWATGWMHNRVRMIAGSFLVKDLMITWLEGARWFWDTLVDADLANNTLGWQWVAGCGGDAAPYFRIFNPETQALKYDPEKTYMLRWISELKSSEYPDPVVDHRAARTRALEAFSSTKSR